jgi:iron complex outermembrane receptor protein
MPEMVYTGIRVRGSDATRVNVTINGIPYNDSESHGTYWVNMPDFASSVESLQLRVWELLQMARVLLAQA